jgi:Uma2 family endonuclease
MSLHARLYSVSEQDYIQGELASEVRHEYVAGRVFAMVGASEAHNLIALGLASELRARLRGGPCKVFMADMKVRVEKAWAFYYPDVMVTCDPTDTEPYFKTRPCVIAEVMSPATEAIDRREKWLAYQQLESLKEYILISQDNVQVEIYRRDAAGGWWVETCTAGDTVRLDSLDLSLPMQAIYQDVLL